MTVNQKFSEKLRQKSFAKSSAQLKDSQTQPPEVFCKKKCFEIFRKFHRKTPVLESLLNKV